IVLLADILHPFRTTLLETFQITLYIVQDLVPICAIKIKVDIPCLIGCIEVQAAKELWLRIAKRGTVRWIHFPVSIDVGEIAVAGLIRSPLINASGRLGIQRIDLRLCLEYTQGLIPIILAHRTPDIGVREFIPALSR